MSKNSQNHYGSDVFLEQMPWYEPGYEIPAIPAKDEAGQDQIFSSPETINDNE